MISPSRASRVRPKLLPAHSAWLAVLAVGGVFGLGAVAAALWPAEDADGLLGTAAPVVPAPLHPRCETCGVIEAIRATAAAEGRPAAWILSVRMRDGSLRHSSAALPGRWQVGESVQLIGGERAWSLPYPPTD